MPANSLRQFDYFGIELKREFLKIKIKIKINFTNYFY